MDVIIPKGTLLYRASENIRAYAPDRIANSVLKCGDTGKIGIYFSNYAMQSIAMATEYGKDLQLGVFKLTDDIRLRVGKYAFRDINPSRYFHDNGKLKFGVVPLPTENIGHYDPESLPIINIHGVDIGRCAGIDVDFNFGEVFLTTQDDISKVRLIDAFQITVTDAVRVLAMGDFKMHNSATYVHALNPISVPHLSSERPVYG